MNNKFCKKKLSIVFFLFFLINFHFSIDLFSYDLSSSKNANRQTALRCAEVAKSFLMEENYSQAIIQVELGLAYDENISDLWYIKSLCSKYKKDPQSFVLDFAKKAYDCNDWTYFSENLGIILYAESLIYTGNNEKAYELLDEKKDIYSSDSEYLRALSCYRLGDVTKARNIITSGVNVFPEDIRFPELFYKNEFYSVYFTGDEIDSGAYAIASNFATRLSSWKKKSNELLFYAHLFEKDEELSNRILLEYFSEYKLVPEALPIAIEKNILTQEDARVAFEKFCEEGIELNLFKKIISSFTDEKQKILLVSFLSKFSGIITYDNNEDFIVDMYVTYSSGRPSLIQQDFNQDDVIDAEILCDFGTPSILYDFKNNLEISYGEYPYIDSVKIFDNTNYFLIQNSYQWSNVKFIEENLCMDYKFYIPMPIFQEEIKTSELFSKSYRISSEIIKENDVYQKRFVLSNGLPIQSTYAKNGIPYGSAIFEGGNILYRYVDKNFDGIYEITEFYNFDTFNYVNYIDKIEMNNLYTELFGTIDALEGLYISKIVVDDNSDGIPECSEEFLPTGKKTTWFDKNGEISVVYEKSTENDSIIEKSFFINPINKKQISVEFENGIPKKLQDSNFSSEILQNDVTPVYWIGSIPDDKLSILVYESLDNIMEQGKVKLLKFSEFPNLRIMIIKIGDNLFAESFEYEEEYF